MRDFSPSAANLQPELQVLLCCARARLEPADAERLTDLLRRELDWESLLDRASSLRVLPLLASHLLRPRLSTVPQSVQDRLREFAQANTRRNLFLTGELLKLLKLFDAHSISAIPYKGPTLAGLAYRSLALRQFQDLDLLLHRAEIAPARALLLAHGYQPAYSLPPLKERAYLESLGQLPFWNEKNDCLVELHTDIAPPAFAFPLDPEELWQRLTEFSLNGNNLLTVAAEDLLLILCVHGTKHNWTSLAWICDVAELLRVGGQLDWAALTERACRLRSERMLLLGLLLAHDLLQAPVPEHLVRRARANRPVVGLAARVFHRFLLPKCEGPLPALQSAAFLLQARERLYDGLGYSLSLALSPTLADWQLFSVPRTLRFLYYLVRPFRLMGKYVQQLWQEVTNALTPRR